MTAATTLRDVVVTNEQTRVQWDAGHASIERGLIVISAPETPPPAGMFDSRSNTFVITGTDGGDRSRRFGSLTLDSTFSDPPRRFTFR